MTSLGLRIQALPLLAALAIGLIAAPAAAQSQSDLRRENQRLKTQITDLQRELEQALEDNRTLKEEIDRLKQLLKAPSDAAAPSAPPVKEVVTIDESKPDASPRALLSAIIDDYRETTADLEQGADENDPKRTAFLRKLNRWAAKVNRQFRSPIEWHVRIIDSAQRVGRGFTLRLQAVDPVTDVTLGDPFDALLSRTLASRLQQLEQRHSLDDVVMVLRGVLTPLVRINEQRLEEGTFDNPRFIGIFAEFDMAVEAQTLLPKPEEKQKKQGKDKDEEPQAGADSAGEEAEK